MARIVHDRRRGAVLISERFGAQRVNRIGEGRPHIVHKSERVSDFVGEHILKRFLQSGFGHLLGAHRLVDLCRLDETPVGKDAIDTAIDEGRTVDDFSRTWVAP